MYSKYKNKGKGIGKGQSNRHKSGRYHRNAENFSENSRIPTNSNYSQRNRNDKYSNKLKRSRDKQLTNSIGYQHSYPSGSFSREDPLMADLLWKNVQPSEQCIPW